MARVRSPNFPVISLPVAIDRIEKIYAKEQTIPATREIIANHLGYSGMNGASLKIVSALLKYGLLEEAKDKNLRVSQLALAIMHPANDQERADALRQASEGPALFQKLSLQFEGRRPSDTNLRSWLLRNGFATSAVNSVISSYSETMDMIGGAGGFRIAADTTATIEPYAGSITPAAPTRLAESVQSPIRQEEGNDTSDPFSVEMLKGRVRVAGELTNREDAQTLIEILKSAMVFLPSTAD